MQSDPSPTTSRHKSLPPPSRTLWREHHRAVGRLLHAAGAARCHTVAAATCHSGSPSITHHQWPTNAPAEMQSFNCACVRARGWSASSASVPPIAVAITVPGENNSINERVNAERSTRFPVTSECQTLDSKTCTSYWSYTCRSFLAASAVERDVKVTKPTGYKMNCTEQDYVNAQNTINYAVIKQITEQSRVFETPTPFHSPTNTHTHSRLLLTNWQVRRTSARGVLWHTPRTSITSFSFRSAYTYTCLFMIVPLTVKSCSFNYFS